METEFSSSQLKGVAQLLSNQWKEERVVKAVHPNWDKFKVAFFDRFFPLKMRE